jgi:Tfp pilus assembly protein PilE
MKRKKSLGMALVFEVLGFFIVLGILTAIGITLYKSFSTSKRVQETKMEMLQIFQFFKSLYMSNLQFIKNGCMGFSNCKYTLTPEPINETTFRIHIADLSLLKMIKDYCSISQTGDSQYDIQCFSQYSGQPLKISIENYQQYQKDFLAPYEGKYTTITLTEPVLNFSATLVLDTEINKSLLDTANILKTFKNAVEKWVEIRKSLAIGNACGDTATSDTDPVGGLGSWDDELIPWVWQAFGYNPFTTTSRGKIPTLCQGIEVGCQCGNNCGCTNFANNPDLWREDISLCRVHNPTELTRFLGHIGLSDIYATDGFGNLLTFVPLSDANGNPALNCPPPFPRCCYRYDIPRKGTIGIYDYNKKRWLYRIEIVY